MTHLTSNTKLDFLGWIPYFEDEFLNTQSIVAFSALLTFKGRPIKRLYQDAIKGEQDIKKKVKLILRRSSLRGHASLSTTPALAISFQGSKFLDSMLTGTIFSSSLMASGRRTETTFTDIVYPDRIYSKKETCALYQLQLQENINFLNLMVKKNIPQDEASKIMPYGIVGTGIIILPLEAIVGFERELELQSRWMPEDGYLFIEKVKRQLKKFGLDDLYYTRKVAPRNVYPYPNIFKDPNLPNFARDCSSKLKPGKLSAIVSFTADPTPNLLERLKSLGQEIRGISTSEQEIKKRWMEVLLARREICRDYNPAVCLSVVSAVSWRVWGEKKRHRTVPQVVDSIYTSVNNALRVFEETYKTIKTGKIEDELLKKIDSVFAVPPIIKANQKILSQYLKIAAKSLFTYKKLRQKGIPEKDAIYIIPRGIRIFVLQKFDLYNLITGYYPLRLCTTAEEQMRRATEEEMAMIKRLLKNERLDDLLFLIKPKCHLVGFCPEQNFCGKIKALIPDYNEKFHQEMKEELETKFLASKGQL